MDLSKHPISKIILLTNTYTQLQNSTFNFSHVLYDYNSGVYVRNFFTKLGSEITPEWLIQNLQSLQEGYELAFHSKIQLPNNSVMHIPMIDFNIDFFDDSVRNIISERINKQKDLIEIKEIFEEISIFSSGRSFHGYGKTILNENDWFKFKVKLILLNYTKNIDSKSTIIDIRWVAHRILENFSSLRWSCNTKKHSKYVELLENQKMLI